MPEAPALLRIVCLILTKAPLMLKMPPQSRPPKKSLVAEFPLKVLLVIVSVVGRPPVATALKIPPPWPGVELPLKVLLVIVSVALPPNWGLELEKPPPPLTKSMLPLPVELPLTVQLFTVSVALPLPPKLLMPPPLSAAKLPLPCSCSPLASRVVQDAAADALCICHL